MTAMNEISVEQLTLQARQLIAGNEAAKAFNMLTSYEERFSGDVRFDYWYGLSALEKGDAGLAIFSLERVINEDPRNGSATVDLARAYYNVGQYKQARQLFEKALQLTPPEQMRLNINNYLDAIARRDSTKTFWTRQIAVSSGYDTNANNGYFIDSINNFTLNERALATESGFIRSSFKLAALEMPKATQVRQWTFNYTANNFSETSYTSYQQILAGMFFSEQLRSGQRYISVNMADQYLASKHYLRISMLNLGMQFNLSNDYWMGIGVQESVSQHEEVYRFRDMNGHEAILSAGMKREHLSGKLDFSFKSNTASVSNSQYTGDSYSLNSYANWNFNKNSQVKAAIKISRYSFDKLFGGSSNGKPTKRIDTSFAVPLSAEYRHKKWTFITEYNYLKRQSSIQLYGNDKHSISIGVVRNI